MSRYSSRRGFTLVELLVAIGIMLILATLALVIVPDAMDQDRVVDTTGSVQQALRKARAHAIRDHRPHGVRFLRNAGQPSISTELQFISEMPMIIPKKGSASPDSWPRVDFILQNGVWKAFLRNLIPVAVDPSGELALLQDDLARGGQPRIHLPGIAKAGIDQTFFRITALVPAGGSSFEMILDRQPELGSATEKRIDHFAFLLEPRQLVGEPIMQLPKGTCVDLAASKPSSTASDLELLFDPNGQMVYEGSEVVYLWVRDQEKGGLNQISPGVFDVDLFRTGGEQRVIQILTRSGATSAYPPLWPQDNGTYLPRQSPYSK